MMRMFSNYCVIENNKTRFISPQIIYLKTIVISLQEMFTFP